MSKKAWIIFIVVCVVVLGGLVYLSRKDKVNVGDIDQTKIIASSAASGNIEEHVFGKRDSKTVLIEYGDFQCPACGSAYHCRTVSLSTGMRCSLNEALWLSSRPVMASSATSGRAISPSR